MYRTLKEITAHPLNRKRKLHTLWRFFSWNLGVRLAGPTVVPFVNHTRLLVAPGMTGATGNVYTGLYEPESMFFLLHYLQGKDLFVDVGANVGVYTVLAGAVCGARTVALEPVPETFQQLLDNIHLNRIQDRTEALPLAAAAAPEALSFTTRLGPENHVVPVGRDQTGSEATVAEAKPLDTILAGGQVPSLIKIDVEGFETAVLQGAAKTLKRDELKAIIIELNGLGSRYGFSDEAVHEKLLDLKFQPCSYDPFSRVLTALSDRPREKDTIIYARTPAVVQRQLQTTPAVQVQGMEV